MCWRYWIKLSFRRLLCKIFGHDWNYCALIDSVTHEFCPACNRCGIEKANTPKG